MRLSLKLYLFISIILLKYVLQNSNHSAIINIDLTLVNDDLESVSSLFLL